MLCSKQCILNLAIYAQNYVLSSDCYYFLSLTMKMFLESMISSNIS